MIASPAAAVGRLLTSVLLLGWAGQTLAEEDPAAWLLRMSESAREANYQGVVVYRDADTFETLRVTHGTKNGVERERLVSLTGEPREILREGEQVMCLLSRSRQMSADGSSTRGLLPRMDEEAVAQLGQTYELKTLGVGRVAGRECRGVRIVPRDAFRYGYEFWADSEHGVPLRVVLLAPNGRALEEMVFTQVEFPDSIPDSAFATRLPMPKREPSARQAAQPLPPSPFSLAQLPKGFRVTLRDVRVGRGGQRTEHILISDGLSAVSIFSARRPAPDKAFRGVSNMGAVHAYGRMIGKFHIAVVGEVPPETVRMIGDGLQPVTTPATAEAAAPSP